MRERGLEPRSPDRRSGGLPLTDSCVRHPRRDRRPARPASRSRTGSRWSKAIDVCRYPMAAMAPPRVARGSTPCRGSILMLDYGARSGGIRRGRMSARGSRVDSRGFGPRPLACRASVLPVHTTSPVTSGEGVEPSRVRRPARIAAWRLAVRPAGQGKGPGAHSTPRSVSGGIVLSVGFPTCSRGDSPFHPFRQERHDRSIILLGGGLVSVRLPGLSAARLATGRVRCGARTFLSSRCGHRQPPTVSWTFIRTQE